MDDLQEILNIDLLRLNELKNEINQLEKKIQEQQEQQERQQEQRQQSQEQRQQQEKLKETLEEMKREADGIFLFVNHIINLINIEKKRMNKKRRIYVFNCFMFEPVGLFFPDHEELIYIIDEKATRRDTEEEEQKRIKILSQYYGDYINEPAPTKAQFKERQEIEQKLKVPLSLYNQCPQYEFKQGNQTNIFIILKKTEDLRIIINNNNKSDAFLWNTSFNLSLLNLLHKNILNVYVSCSNFISVIQETEFKPIKEKFRMIRADCLGSRQNCDFCAPPAVMSYYQQYSNLLKQKEN